MAWTNEYDSVFFISIATLVFGGLGVALKYCLKSRCEHLSFCFGAVVIERRVDLEAQEEMKQIEMGSGKPEEKDEMPTLDLSKLRGNSPKKN